MNHEIKEGKVMMIKSVGMVAILSIKGEYITEYIIESRFIQVTISLYGPLDLKGGNIQNVSIFSHYL